MKSTAQRILKQNAEFYDQKPAAEQSPLRKLVEKMNAYLNQDFGLELNCIACQPRADRPDHVEPYLEQKF